MIQTFERQFSQKEIYFLQVLFASFKIFGSAPFTFSVPLNQSNNKKQWTIKLSYSKMGSIYNFVLLLFLIMIMIWILSDLERYIDFHNNEVTTIYTIGIISTGIINLIFIISIYSIKQKELLKYINVLLYLDKSVLTKFDNNYRLEFQKCLIKKFFFYITHNLILIGISAYNKRYIEFVFHAVAYIIGNIISQYVIILIFISKIYQHLNDVLLSLSKSKEKRKSSHIFLIDTGNNDEILQKIVFIRKIQRDLSEVLCNFSHFFSMSLLLSLFFLCGCSVLHSSYVGLIIFSKKNWPLDNVYILLIMVKEIYLVLLLTCSVTTLMSEIKRTSDIVYKLVGAFFSRITVKRQLEQFSIELLHRKSLSFTACGLFPLDNSLLTSVARVVTTYMILLMEFQFYGLLKAEAKNRTK